MWIAKVMNDVAVLLHSYDKSEALRMLVVTLAEFSPGTVSLKRRLRRVYYISLFVACLSVKKLQLRNCRLLRESYAN